MLAFCRKIYWVRSIVCGTSVLIAGSLYAQPGLQLYDFNNVAQSTLLNPATPVQANYTLGVYGLGNVYTPITLSDVFESGVSLEQSITNIIEAKKIQNFPITLNAKVGAFFGFRLKKKNYISIGAEIVSDSRVQIPQNLLEVLWNGTNPYVGQTLHIGPKIYSSTYMSYHLGFSREFSPKFSAGIRVKLLSGIQNIHTPYSKLQLNISDDDPITKYTYRSDLNYEVRMNNYNYWRSQPFSLTNLLFKNGINGVGVDLGIRYAINDKWTLSASVLDLGFISWSEDIIRLHRRGTSLDFKGVELGTLHGLSTSGSNTIQTKLNEAVEKLGFDTSYGAYTTRLQAQFYMGASYQLTSTTRASATFYGRTMYDEFNYSFGLAVSQKLWSVVDLRLGWSVYNNKFDNVGVGFALNLYGLQIYAMTENVLAAFRYDKEQFMNFRVGVNINVGLNNDRDKDGVPNRKDKCKKIPGLPIFDGCPDTDKDSVPDFRDSCRLDSGSVLNNGCPLDLDRDKDSVPNKLDSCPDVKGLKTANGCPDEDGDGVPDYQDSCKSIVGSPFANGCPDQDEDGIADQQDSCAYIVGTREFYGCPTQEALINSRYDQDGDAVPDSIDRCPTLRGSPLLNGCPDWDGDGVPDDQDSCLELSGKLQFNGCPDTDGDGVPDYVDECITLAGSVAYKGCPTLASLGKQIQSGTGQQIEGDAEVGAGIVRNIALNPTESRVLTKAFTNLEFAFQSATILPASHEALDNLSALLQKNANAKLILIGHTDATGSEYFNQILSYRRANSVKRYLLAKGVTNKIETYGLGKSSPIASNATREGRSRNRRVEIAIVEE